MSAECAICTETFTTQLDLSSLKCGHVFCSGCIKEWLKKREICPICKTAVEKPQRIHLFAAVAATADASANLHNASRDWDNDNSGSNGMRLGERLESAALAVECVARGNPEVLELCRTIGEQVKLIKESLPTTNDRILLRNTLDKNESLVSKLQQSQQIIEYHKREIASAREIIGIIEKKEAEAEVTKQRMKAELERERFGWQAKEQRLKGLEQKYQKSDRENETHKANITRLKRRLDEATRKQQAEWDAEDEVRRKDQEIRRLQKENGKLQVELAVAKASAFPDVELVGPTELSTKQLRRHTKETGGPSHRAADPCLLRTPSPEVSMVEPKLDNSAYGYSRKVPKENVKPGLSTTKKRPPGPDAQAQLKLDGLLQPGPKRSRRVKA